MSMVSCQKGPTRHAYAWQIGPFWQDTLDVRATLETTKWYLVKGYSFKPKGLITNNGQGPH